MSCRKNYQSSKPFSLAFTLDDTVLDSNDIDSLILVGQRNSDLLLNALSPQQLYNRLEKSGVKKILNEKYRNIRCIVDTSDAFNDKALRTYQMMVKEFENTPHATRIHVNMGNIYYKEKNYGNAMRMYQMALDNVSETNRIYRHWIRRNMAYTQLVQHQYDAAM
ncbi:MAG: hypothetical protein EZS28_035682, partial [Streblomastix strix]